MTVGFKIAGGTDLDSVFKARSSAPAAATGFKAAGGTDLNQRFEPRGSTTARAATGFKIAGGTDLAQVFMDINANPTESTTLALVAGVSGGSTGYNAAGTYPGASLTPKVTGTSPYTWDTIVTSGSVLTISLTGASAPPNTDAAWSGLTLSGVFSPGSSFGVARSSIAGSYSVSGNRSTWTFSTTNKMQTGTTYDALTQRVP